MVRNKTSALDSRRGRTTPAARWLTVAAFLFAAFSYDCGGDPPIGPGTPVLPEDLVGTWNLKAVRYEGESIIGHAALSVLSVEGLATFARSSAVFAGSFRTAFVVLQQVNGSLVYTLEGPAATVVFTERPHGVFLHHGTAFEGTIGALDADRIVLGYRHNKDCQDMVSPCGLYEAEFERH